MGDGADGSHGNHWARVYAPRRPFQAGPGCASPVVALALAFVAAVRAMEEAMPRLRDVLSSMQDTD
jgi:hypothetical protein